MTIPNNSSLVSLNSLNNKPDKKPASIVFNKQIKMVPKTFKGIKIAIVSGVKITHKPLIKPKSNPHQGPSNKAPTAIGSNERLILIGPTLINRPSIYNTISIAPKAPVVTIHLVLSSIR